LGKKDMLEKTLKLPFITKISAEKETLSYPAELACVTCLAESQRKKSSFLREPQERIAFISKVYYPLWVLPTENSALIIDGLRESVYKFNFEEPAKTAVLIEELKKNSGNLQKFEEALRIQAKEAEAFGSPVTFSFAALVNDRELLEFLPEYFRGGVFEEQPEDGLIPPGTDAKMAGETARLFVKCLRTVEADEKGLRYALVVLNEELNFHTNAVHNEIEGLQEKFDVEYGILKPVFDKVVEKLTNKHEKTRALLQKGIERKLVALDRRRERYMRKLHIVEQRRDVVKRRIETAKKKGSSRSNSGSFALKKYEREADNTKKEIRTVTDEIYRLKKEEEKNLKQIDFEFQKTVAEEESKIAKLKNACTTKKAQKQGQIEEIASLAYSITESLENIIDELKLSASVLRSKVLANFKPDDPEATILAQLPIYLVKYVKDEEERYSVVSPISIGQEVSILSGIRNIFATNSDPKLKNLTRPTNRKLQETLTVEFLGKIHGDSTFRARINELCRSANAIDQNMFGQILNEGLDEMEKKGLMTHEEAANMCKHMIGESA
jgi:hypothetical protein